MIKSITKWFGESKKKAIEYNEQDDGFNKPAKGFT